MNSAVDRRLPALSLSLRGWLAFSTPRHLAVGMLNELTSTCEHCDRVLDDDHCMLVFETDEGQRRAYECDCGAVTITVHR
ncbi:Uncharacterized protein HSEST_1063 [Halapricum desulfuricans]|uniref:Uncharacterized protein n=1 Tax=Halapricum desulfuricans TaxID=2841257 RepID=A0A897NPB5_9EURY|nr:Uncharacterized protein HSEST_1063 [Halapricum desulfuricans]